MKEDVCVILNEREGQKAKIAETLVEKLLSRGFSASRLSVGKNLIEIVKERSPRVLVLDYLLGDFTTGLDLMESYQDQAPRDRPAFVFLTDEPSVPVAVEAMRLGAVNYFEIENPQSISYVIENIEEISKSAKKTKSPAKPHTPNLNSITAQSKVMRNLTAQVKSLALSREPITVIWGRPGSGKSLLSDALFFARHSGSYYRQVEFDMYDGTIEKLTGIKTPCDTSLKLGSSLSLSLDHVEADTGELLDLVANERKNIWRPETAKDNDSFLTVATSSVETFKAWSRLSGASSLKIPPLKERPEDISPLIQRFIREAAEAAGIKPKPWEADLILELTDMEWPGETAQLRAVVFDAVITSSHTNMDPKDLIDSSRQRWDEEHTPLYQDPDPLFSLSVLEMSDYNYRIAAAKLGCSVQTLKSMVSTGE